MVGDGELTGSRIGAHVLPLLKDPLALATMTEAALSQGRPDAADALADMVVAAAS
jgi:UDP-N-acetylglucosamine--N-acetylmuramyl-(pentapeptide) pyrophosphoryl-undecaprenol N-acetylglucosamine transferase